MSLIRREHQHVFWENRSYIYELTMFLAYGLRLYLSGAGLISLATVFEAKQ